VQTVKREFFQAGLATAFLVGFSLYFGPRPDFSLQGSTKPAVRLAYFPNLTHAPAIIGVADGIFAKSLPEYAFTTKVVNAGPEAMEALVAGAVDVAYVGPSPALNTYVKSHGKALKILAGVCEGGAALMCRADLSISSVSDLGGHRIAVPEFGGTQDVSLRHFLKQAGLSPREQGGTVEILPIKNPEILSLFKQKELDAAWVPEPWASRLQVEAGAHLVTEEAPLWPNGQFSTTVMVASTKFLEDHPDAAEKLVIDNADVIGWIASHPREAQEQANNAIGKITGKPLKSAIVRAAWSNLKFSSRQDRNSLQAFAIAASDAGYLKADQRLETGLWADPVASDKKVLTLASK
jgi:NitT/TauT family transport system substrate-binding protein